MSHAASKWLLVAASYQVSRIENLARYTERKRAGELDWRNPHQLSSPIKHQNTECEVVTGGFERGQ
jgi:hypothetical protein